MKVPKLSTVGRRHYRDVFHIDGKRVRSLTVAHVRGRTVPRKVSVPPRSAPSHC
ncbi:MAG TPA: hypothetical protein VIL45_02550 [Thermoplasmata archaeon]